ncbi:FAD-dependent oxidoreductase [Adlercreutzia shanghongiae]|uniref:Urocanate reductase n=1 Tax=Adlercreutzia shanghongiae TaxID=3111773 RepID=A0ABU6J046_9ACTN|nr:FAD-dependent oxidoreductase [Adlercreutzia sp. R22]MEC4295405.1 FAD-dependent oxidoreductase [Adlercreutzia sp. R22]
MSYSNEGMTRRQALTLMGIGGAAAAAFTVAGCSPQQAPAGDEPAQENLATTGEQEAAPAKPTEYAEYDAIVVGAGGAGLTAAVGLSYFGAERVLLLEADKTAGGNTLISHGSISTPRLPDYAKPPMTPRYQNYIDAIIEGGPQNESEERYWDQFLAEYKDWQENGDTSKVFDSLTFHCIDYARCDEIAVDEEMVLYERTPEFYTWLDEEVGVRFKEGYGGSGYPWPRCSGVEGAERGEGWIETFFTYLEEKNAPVEIRYSTPAVSLIADGEGNIVGVNAEGADGSKLAAFAKRGVVLATGGFTSNRDMLIAYNLDWPYSFMKHANTDGTAFQNGDAITMAQAYGAAVNQMERIQFLTQCDAKTGAENTLVGDRSLTLLRVNQNGERFVAEDASRLEMTRAILALPEQYAYQISDKNTSLIEDGKNAFGVPVSTLQELGTLFVADTIEELANAFGADPAIFAKTVETYNGYCDAYSDPDFGNTLCAPECKTLEPPFYAYAIAPASHITYGGLVADPDNFTVKKFDGETILEGVYSIGDTREGAGGVDIGLPDGYYVAKYLMNEVAERDLKAAIETAKADEEAAAEASNDFGVTADAIFADGTYTGSGNGMGGEIDVTLEVSGGQISVTDISPNNETVGIGGYEAIEDGTYIQLIEAAQGPDFDVISGATITSNAIQTAVTEALQGAVA